AFLETGRFAGPIAEIVQLCTSDDGAPLDFDLRDAGRMDRKLSLHSFVQHNPPHGERLAAPRAAPGDDHTGKNLNALFVAFKDFCVDVDGVADIEVGDLWLEARLFDQFEYLLAHTFRPRIILLIDSCSSVNRSVARSFAAALVLRASERSRDG